MEKEWGWRAIGIVKECSSYIDAAETMDLSNRWNGIEKIEERWLESNWDDWDGTWISMTTALEAEEIWIATLIVHDHIQPQSHSKQWIEMRGRERWVVGGVEWRNGRGSWRLSWIVPLYILLCTPIHTLSIARWIVIGCETTMLWVYCFHCYVAAFWCIWYCTTIFSVYSISFGWQLILLVCSIWLFSLFFRGVYCHLNPVFHCLCWLVIDNHSSISTDRECGMSVDRYRWIRKNCVFSRAPRIS